MHSQNITRHSAHEKFHTPPQRHTHTHTHAQSSSPSPRSRSEKKRPWAGLLHDMHSPTKAPMEFDPDIQTRRDFTITVLHGNSTKFQTPISFWMSFSLPISLPVSIPFSDFLLRRRRAHVRNTEIGRAVGRRKRSLRRLKWTVDRSRPPRALLLLWRCSGAIIDVHAAYLSCKGTGFPRPWLSGAPPSVLRYGAGYIDSPGWMNVRMNAWMTVAYMDGWCGYINELICGLMSGWMSKILALRTSRLSTQASHLPETITDGFRMSLSLWTGEFSIS